MIRWLVIIATLLQAAGVEAVSTEKEQHVSSLEKLKNEIAALSERLFEQHSEIDQLTAELEQKELTLAETQREMVKQDRDIAQLQTELKQLADHRNVLEVQRQSQQALVARELKSAYRLGRAEPVKLLLNQEDPQQLARILKYHRYFTEARQEKLQAFAATIDELTAVESSISNKRLDLKQNREALAQQANTLKKEQEQRSLILANLESQFKTAEAKLGKLEQERKGLEELIARLEAAVFDLSEEVTTPFAKRKGKLEWPLKGTLTKAFGNQRAQNMHWTGWMIEAPEGQAVNAVHTGRVVFSDYLRGQGLMIIVDHGGGSLSLYSHNQMLLKDVGDWVQPGDKLALSGNTGGLKKSALYFEIRHNGKPQDPQKWLAKR